MFRLSYLNAFLMEVQRKASIVPNAVPHCAVRDTEFQGYIIPKVFEWMSIKIVLKRVIIFPISILNREASCLLT